MWLDTLVVWAKKEVADRRKKPAKVQESAGVQKVAGQKVAAQKVAIQKLKGQEVAVVAAAAVEEEEEEAMVTVSASSLCCCHLTRIADFASACRIEYLRRFTEPNGEGKVSPAAQWILAFRRHVVRIADRLIGTGGSSSAQVSPTHNRVLHELLQQDVDDLVLPLETHTISKDGVE
jgi:hypothetical protein